jgi:hypothetical protein
LRQYNFSVRFTTAASPEVLCRIRFDGRFDAHDMVGDFQKNVAHGYLNRCLRTPSAAGYTYRVGVHNSMEIVTPLGTRAVSDGERASLLNLIDLGPPFEAKRLQPSKPSSFPLGHSSGYSVDAHLTGLVTENALRFS